MKITYAQAMNLVAYQRYFLPSTHPHHSGYCANFNWWGLGGVFDALASQSASATQLYDLLVVLAQTLKDQTP